MALLKAAAPALAILLAGCELTRDPITIDPQGRELMVHGVLEAGRDTVAILLTRVVVDGDSVLPSAQPVSGATVRLTGGGETVLLAEASAGFPPCLEGSGAGCYTGIVRGGVRAGETYELAVRAPGGEEARGSARVPGVPVLSSPAAGSRLGVRRRPERVPAASIAVRWRGAEDAGRIGVGLVLKTLYPRTLDIPHSSCTIPQNVIFTRSPGTDTATIVLHQPALCHTRDGTIEPDSIRAGVLVVAYDSALTRYEDLLRTYPGKSLQRQRFAAGVSGALGVFAAIARTEREIVLVPID